MSTASLLALSAAAGLVGGAGLAVFYRALTLGSMSVVAPVTALLSAGVPVLVGIGAGDRPQGTALAGIAVALLAIGLISREPSASGASVPAPGPHRLGVVGLALVSGFAFGLFFVALDMAGNDGGLWPLVSARTASVTLFVLLGLIGVGRLSPPRTAWRAAMIAGVLDATANAFYLIALSHGLLSVVAVLTALYPAGTVLLARWVLGERMSASQHAGLACATAAALLIAA